MGGTINLAFMFNVSHQKKESNEEKRDKIYYPYYVIFNFFFLRIVSNMNGKQEWKNNQSYLLWGRYDKTILMFFNLFTRNSHDNGRNCLENRILRVFDDSVEESGFLPNQTKKSIVYSNNSSSHTLTQYKWKN